MAGDVPRDESEEFISFSKEVPAAPEAEGDSLANAAPDIDLSQVQARQNLQETAFFLPQLRTDEKGEVFLEFESPEALTRWNVWLLAHDRTLQHGYGRFQTVTQKELMVVPNMPRFLREGDRMVVRAKLSNLSEEDVVGKAELSFSDPITGDSLSARLGLKAPLQDFAISAGGNGVVSWEIAVPAGLQAVQYKIVAGTGVFSDGQQEILPVLTNRTLVTETVPLWVNGRESRSFRLKGLGETTSSTLSHQQLTVEVSGNPVWYAVKSLPYLMEFPYECSEQTFARLYANGLGAYIVRSFPQIAETWKQWEGTGSLESPLEKNPELRALLIEETPWLRDAQSEQVQQQRMAQLYEAGKLDRELRKAIDKLQGMQLGDGGFPWFKGSRYPSRYITQHIVSGMGHLKALGIEDQVAPLGSGGVERMLARAVTYLDNRIAEDYRELLKQAEKIRDRAKNKALGEKARTDFLSQNQLSSERIQYLYARSFFPELALSAEAELARKYYLQQLTTYWDRYGLHTWAMAGLSLHRSGESATAERVWTAIDQLRVENEETGIFWKENRSGWYWYEAPVETQALLIEFAEEVMPAGDEKEARLAGMKTWLLKQKQTQAWKTTKATTEAVYALLRGGSQVLEPGLVSLTLGSKPIADWNPVTSDKEAGTGYQMYRFPGDRVVREMADIGIEKANDGPAWGAAYWQYFEDLDKVKAAETPLKLRRQLLRREFTAQGEVLSPVSEGAPLKVGDLVRVRIELESDRRMEYLHLKDQRAASFEPVDVISGYRYQEGLWYYQSTRDASTDFFIEDLDKGIYVFEYDLRVSQEGVFSHGYAQIQSMYAPEFSSHSEGIKVRVTAND